MDMSNELLEKARAVKSAEELLALAAENGVTLTAEEANAGFTQLCRSAAPAEGELSDVELENVAGASICKGGRSYSEDPPHHLIVTVGNSCSGFVDADTHIRTGDGYCPNCAHSFTSGLIRYCRFRTIDSDPYNR